jgi:hypothetical protein
VSASEHAQRPAPAPEPSQPASESAPPSGISLPSGLLRHYGVDGTIWRRAAVVSQAVASPAQAFGEATSGAASEVPHRGRMEASFGESFAGVRAYLGCAQPMSALGAEAATHRDQVVFGSSAPSVEVVAHELTHVVQQRRGGGAVQGKNGVSDPACAAEREADHVAARVAAGERVDVQAAPSSELHLKRQGLVNQNVTGTAVPSQSGISLLKGAYVTILSEHDDRIVVATADGTQAEIAKASVTEAQDNPEGEIALAKQMAGEFLTLMLGTIGVNALDGTEVAALIAKVPVKLFQKEEWKSVVAKESGGNPDDTEGLTIGKQRGSRRVGINAGNYTTFAIVHELFHVLEAEVLGAMWGEGLPDGMVEGITELLTSRCAGFFATRQSARGGNVYLIERGVVELALTCGAVSFNNLLRAYFLGDFSGVQKLRQAWDAIVSPLMGSNSVSNWREKIMVDAERYFRGK